MPVLSGPPPIFPVWQQVTCQAPHGSGEGMYYFQLFASNISNQKHVFELEDRSQIETLFGLIRQSKARTGTDRHPMQLLACAQLRYTSWRRSAGGWFSSLVIHSKEGARFGGQGRLRASSAPLCATRRMFLHSLASKWPETSESKRLKAWSH